MWARCLWGVQGAFRSPLQGHPAPSPELTSVYPLTLLLRGRGGGQWGAPVGAQREEREVQALMLLPPCWAVSGSGLLCLSSQGHGSSQPSFSCSTCPLLCLFRSLELPCVLCCFTRKFLYPLINDRFNMPSSNDPHWKTVFSGLFYKVRSDSLL